MTIERSPRQIRLLTALLLFGTFLSGAVAGAGFARWMHLPPPPPRPAPFLPGPPGALKLTPAQEAKARAITEHYRPQLEAILRANFPKVQAINEQMEKELREMLTPEQIKVLDDIKAHRPPMPPGGPMPGAGPPPPGESGFMPPPGPPPWPQGRLPPHGEASPAPSPAPSF
jgi:Spy/CpxP family protein refolding chaperone